LNIFSHFSRDEIGMLVEELCRTGLHFVAANQDDLKKHQGWREVIFYPRSDDFKVLMSQLKGKLACPLITRLLMAIDDMRSVAGCTQPARVGLGPNSHLLPRRWECAL
jgi:hypothetical protein